MYNTYSMYGTIYSSLNFELFSCLNVNYYYDAGHRRNTKNRIVKTSRTSQRERSFSQEGSRDFTRKKSARARMKQDERHNDHKGCCADSQGKMKCLWLSLNSISRALDVK